MIAKREAVIEEYLTFINDKTFPCVAARAAVAREQVQVLVVNNMACPAEDKTILSFLYEFVDIYRNSKKLFHSAAVVFSKTGKLNEEIFETCMWQRLQALADLDAVNYTYDQRVDADPSSPLFSYSLKQEAFFIIGMHPESSRSSRKFKYPAIIFNIHAEFEKLRVAGLYDNMKDIVRKRDSKYSGSVNPMLDDFGRSSEAAQYSGIQYTDQWKCPLIIRHGTDEHNSST